MTLGVPGSYKFRATIAANTTQYNLRAAAVAAGWDQVNPLDAEVTINSGIYISSNSTGVYAFDTGASFPPGSRLAVINNGFIVGRGGNGGAGSRADPSIGTNIAGSAGAAGGGALYVQFPISVTNAGTIAGGGGGGGGGEGHKHVTSDTKGTYVNQAEGGGGGGGRSNTAADASGGSPNGGTGTVSSPGGGGAGGNYELTPVMTGGAGGTGGAWGTGGNSGGGGSGGSSSCGGPYGGGAGGAAVLGNTNITWINTGTRLGAIT